MQQMALKPQAFDQRPLTNPGFLLTRQAHFALVQPLPANPAGMRQVVVLLGGAAQRRVAELGACSANQVHCLQGPLWDEIVNQKPWAGQTIEVPNPVSNQMVLIQDS